MYKILLMALLFYGMPIYGQTRYLINETLPHEFNVRYGNIRETPANQLELIKELSAATGTTAGQTYFIVKSDIQKTLTEINRNQYKAEVRFNDLKVSPEKRYGEFLFSELLIPAEANFSIVVSGKNNTELARMKQRVTIQQGSTQPAILQFKDSSNAPYHVSIIEFSYGFSSHQVNRLRSFIQKVDQYYSSKKELDAIEFLLSGINPGNYELLDEMANRLTEAEDRIQFLENKNIADALPLANNDPIRYRQRMQALQQQAMALKSAIVQTRSSIHLYFYTTGLDLNARGKKQQAYAYFKRALSAHPFFAPAAYQLAVIEKQDGLIDESECRLRNVLLKMNPDPDMFRLSMQMESDIYNEYIQSAASDNSNQQHYLALDKLRKATSICKTFSAIPCTQLLETETAKAYQGIYDLKMEDVKIAYGNNDLIKADQLLTTAIDYKLNHANYITNDRESKSMRLAIKASKPRSFMSRDWVFSMEVIILQRLRNSGR